MKLCRVVKFNSPPTEADLPALYAALSSIARLLGNVSLFFAYAKYVLVYKLTPPVDRLTATLISLINSFQTFSVAELIQILII